MARLTLEIADTVRDRIEKLKTLSEAATITEIVRRSFSLFEILLEHEAAGGRVELRSADGSVRQLVVR